ncbi:MAG: nucleotide exchange factor GrpE [Alistipes sp.]|nr:nucleotide exchange factor GrpE [Alistipes sp.]MBQ6869732.1 nucleotide exchange factor GrpE [Alistipes sp.]MBQ9962141.1 nucleotide exchange factor GrpE [Alistipes sp.]
MNKKNTENQEIKDQTTVSEDVDTSATDNATSDNMADQAEAEADTVAEKSAEELIDWKDQYIRLQAEFDNYRKRTIREKMDLIQSGGSDILKAILPILDDMQRATAASEKSDDINALREGERLVVQKFIDTLRQKKVVEIEALDCPFDENLHEAVARFAAGEEKKGKVIDVIERGYMLGDKVLRFAKVVVGE